MSQRSICRILFPFALSLVSATITLAQSSTGTQVLKLPPRRSAASTWELARKAGPSKGKIFVVALDQPQRRQACRIQSFTLDKLVCSRAFGGSRTYLPQQVLALIRPGDEGFRHLLLVVSNAQLGASIWGTVVLVATCPACAAATAFVAFYSFGAAAVALFGDDQPDRLLYLASGQQLTGKLRLIQP
jgi:hypothetical protein